ncbi:PTS sugar transporter subunit IIA [candidate division KSB1 bacterium]|nr:PTS sugar transporter subunit IIA [candidate division KSB1 bacterium]
MTIAELISTEVVKVPLESKVKPDVIRELVQILMDAGKINDMEAVVEAVNTREELASTGLEAGIAVPHAKTDAVNDLTVALGISPDGCDFDAMDGQPSHLFFLLLAPPDQSGPHLAALSDIAKIAGSRSFCKLLRNARSAEEVVELFLED